MPSRATRWGLGLLGLLVLCATTLLTDGQVRALAEQAGRYGPFAIGLYIFATQVFAPLSGAPAIIVGVRLYGPEEAIAILYSASMASAVCDFWIARRWGRRIVGRLVSDEDMTRLDTFAGQNVRSLLIVSRVLGYYFFDIISYGIGLTRVPFTTYMAYTAVFTIVPTLLELWLLRSLDVSKVSGVLWFYVALGGTGAAFAFYYFRAVSKSKRTVQGDEHP